VTLADLNALPPGAAAAELLRCCGSSTWARLMTADRPFAGETEMADCADRIWRSLGRADWLEAFAAHPRIGDDAPARNAPATAAWSAEEQQGMRGASADARVRLAQANREYEARFGYVFIVCATGKSAGEMLALLEERLGHGPDKELQVAAEEQRRITRLRLGRLLTD
jgi:2-oxo-4-hydroxy-4-carboxy-5-ureidoimidazoline decarboxylase